MAYKDKRFYIVECKPEFDDGDLMKVSDVLSSNDRLRNFYVELEQYQLLKRVGYSQPFSEFVDAVEGVLAYSGTPKVTCPLHQLVVSDWKGAAKLIEVNK